MTIKSSGPISIADIAAELRISAEWLSLGDSRVRALLGHPTGAVYMSSAYGKSSGSTFTLTPVGSRGSYGYSDDSRLGMTGGSVSPNPIPNIGTVTSFYWTVGPEVREDYGYEFLIAGVPAGTTYRLSVTSGGVTRSGNIVTGGDSDQTSNPDTFGVPMAFLMDNVRTQPVTMVISRA